MTFRQRLLISMLMLALLPLLVSSVLAYQSTSGVVRDDAIAATDRATASTFHAMQHTVDNLYKKVLEVVSLPELLQYTRSYLGRGSSAMSHIADTVKAQLRAFAAATAADISGLSLYLLDHTVHTYEIGSPHRSADIVRNTLSSAGVPVWTIDYRAPRKNGLPPITISNVYLSTSSSETMGTIVLTINDGIFQELRNASAWTEGEMYFMLDRDNRVMLHPSPDMIGSQYEDAAVMAVVNAPSGAPAIINFEGRDCIVRAMEISRTGWKVFYVIPYEYFFAQRDVILETFLITAIPCALIALCLALWLALSIYKPLNQLTLQMNSNAPEALALRVTEEGPREIKNLAHEYNQLMDRIARLIDEIELQSSMKRDMELAALRAQIMPHFIYNTLNAIKCLAAAGDTDATQKAAATLISLLRGSIGSNRDMVPLRKDIGYVQNYLYLQSLRMDLHFTLKLSIPDELMDCIVPRFALQPIVENALMHAFSEMTADNQIEISAEASQDKLRIAVRDNGSGISQMASAALDRKLDGREAYTFNEVGLPNVNERVKKLFGPDYGISYHNLEHGCEIQLTVKWIRPNSDI